MIKILSIALLVLLTVSFAPAQVQAGQAILSWTAPTTNEDGTPLTDLAGYNVYAGKVSRGQQEVVLLTIYPVKEEVNGIATTYTVKGLSDGTWYFSVTAYNSKGTESAYSNEVNKVIINAPSKPTGCTVQ